MQRCFILNVLPNYKSRFNNLLLFLLVLPVMFSCSAEPESATIKDDPKAETISTPESNNSEVVVLFFGNSLTAAYGLDPADGFTGLVEKKTDSLQWPVKVINAGVTGETTATGSRRIDWVLEQQKIDVFVLELGANDGLRGIPVTETYRNLNQIIAAVRKHDSEIQVVLAGMMVPPNMGQDYSDDFRTIFPRVAEEQNVHLIPFLLEGVAGESSLNLDDGIHPNKKGHRIVAETVWSTLGPIIEEAIKVSQTNK